MRPTTPKLRDLAERLLGYEAAAGRSATSDETAAFRICEKFRHRLSVLLGAGGFWALLARALSLAMVEAPELSAVQVNAAGSLEGLTRSDRDGFADGEIVLIGQFLGLLVTFIGEALTMRLVHDIWPKAAATI